jgi:hypothetical protein
MRLTLKLNERTNAQYHHAHVDGAATFTPGIASFAAMEKFNTRASSSSYPMGLFNHQISWFK